MMRRQEEGLPGPGHPAGPGGGRFQPLDGRASYRSVITEGMYRGMGTLVIGSQQKPAVAVGGQKGGTGL